MEPDSQKFYCLCDGGLGNRLNSLVSGLIIWKNHFKDTKFIIVWPLNRYCGAHIESLLNLQKIKEFVGHPLIFQIDIDSISLEKNYIILANDKKDFDGIFFDIYSISSIKREQFEKKDNYTQHFLFSAPLLPFFLKFKDIMKVKDLIEPSMTVLEQFQYKKNQLGTRSIALHLRGTDYGFSKLYFDIIFKLVQFFSFLNFQIFTDDKIIIQRFSTLANIYFFDASDLPNKYDPAYDWSQKFSKEYNINRNDLSVLNGFSEMLVLASLPKIITSRSTFLYNAFFLSEKKLNFGFFMIFTLNRLVAIVRYLKIRGK